MAPRASVFYPVLLSTIAGLPGVQFLTGQSSFQFLDQLSSYQFSSKLDSTYVFSAFGQIEQWVQFVYVTDLPDLLLDNANIMFDP